MASPSKSGENSADNKCTGRRPPGVPVKEFKMKAYRIKGPKGRTEMLEILRENSEGFQVKITRDRSGWLEEKKEFMPRELFETCLRTSYLTEVSSPK